MHEADYSADGDIAEMGQRLQRHCLLRMQQMLPNMASVTR
jgi:hypothetical protein